ncbi:hypothetical protein GGR57DRAFT_506074 [Xylariaceae sp. FL1272]|nr:hypothetical protein GGR57DRAFT_506074 [Xylariaceae sp. FL1272]
MASSASWQVGKVRFTTSQNGSITSAEQHRMHTSDSALDFLTGQLNQVQVLVTEPENSISAMKTTRDQDQARTVGMVKNLTEVHSMVVNDFPALIEATEPNSSMSPRETNSAARLENAFLRAPHHRLVPLVSRSGDRIEHFPRTLVELNLMRKAEISAVLKELGKSTEGSLPDLKRRLGQVIGIANAF